MEFFLGCLVGLALFFGWMYFLLRIGATTKVVKELSAGPHPYYYSDRELAEFSVDMGENATYTRGESSFTTPIGETEKCR